MKGNDGTGNVAERDEWQTPQWLFDKLNEQYGFTFDCCADDKNTKCVFYSEDFLDYKHNLKSGTCSWMNPPFSKALHMFDQFFKVVGRGVSIYRCDNMETSIWQDVIFKHATWIFIPKKSKLHSARISYEGFKGKGARFPSALIGFNIEPPQELEGTTCYLKTTEKQNGIQI